MAGSSIGRRVLWVVSAAVAAGWLGCSEGALPTTDSEPSVATKTKQALDPGWTPDSLDRLAHYVAGPSPAYANIVNGGVQTWVDRSGNGHHLTMDNSCCYPEYHDTGWVGKPTLTFAGHHLLIGAPWSGAPNGLNEAVTVLAVMRSAGPQDAGIASWWDVNGGGILWAGLRKADALPAPNQLTLLDLTRNHEFVWTQPFQSPHDIGTTRHVVAWGVDPASQTIRLSVDGTTSASTGLQPIEGLPAMPLYVGAASGLPTGLFSGDLSELIVVRGSMSDHDIQNYTEWASTNWGGIGGPGSADPCFDANNNPTPDTTRCDDGLPNTYGDHCSSGTCVGTVPPPGGPAGLAPIGWYHAGPAEVVITGGGVSTWYDRSPHHNHLFEGFYYGRPIVAPEPWGANKPSPLRFSGNQAIRRQGWDAVPNGDESPFTLLAVVRSVPSQNAALASWWRREGGTSVTAMVKPSGALATLGLFRNDDYLNTQTYPSTPTLDMGPHVLVWRYGHGVTKFTIDGATTQSADATVVAPMDATEFLIGAQNDVASTLFHGDIAELALVPGSLTDAQVDAFDSYAQQEWGGFTLTLPCTPDCNGKAPGENNGCGPLCGGSGAVCSPSAPCGGGLGCNDGTCVSCPTPCTTVACGTPDACGVTCGCGTQDPGGPCFNDNDCGGGLHCMSGTCGGGPVQTGCANDADCEPGYSCALGVGEQFGLPAATNVCWPLKCNDKDPSLPGCGVGDDPSCGTCPACTASCGSKECGGDGCGGTCGTCGAGLTCNPAGRCVDKITTGEFATSGHFDGFPVPLDEGDTAEVGSLPGTLRVSNRGAVEYRIPLRVPPARAGFEPHLALEYTGSKQEGLMGPGWRIAGLSAIARCSRPGSPVDYHNAEFCLDGAHLVDLDPTSESPDHEFRTEVDTFAKVVGHGFSGTAPELDGPTYFEVSTKDGRRLTYGQNDEAHSSVLAHSTKRVWAVDSERDRAGNQILYTYKPHTVDAQEEDDPSSVDTGELVPDAITYNGNDAGLPADAWVQFSYVDRPDPVYHFVNGQRGFSKLRLSKATTYVSGDAVQTYVVAYPDVGPTTVQSVKLCTDDGSGGKPCQPATTFQYYPSQAYEAAPGWVTLGSAQEKFVAVLDQDGDGRSDVLKQYPTPAGDHYHVVRTRIAEDGTLSADEIPLAWSGSVVPNIIIDVDADGASDIVDPSTGIIWLSNYDSFTQQHFDVPSLINIPLPLRAAAVADVDGNGQQDLVTVDGIAGGIRFFRTQNAAISHWVDFSELPTNCKSLLSMDIDGDAADELLCLPSGGGEVVAVGATFGSDPPTPKLVHTGIQLVSDASEVLTMDLNGDGLKDVIERTPGEVLFWENTGENFEPRALEVDGNALPPFTTASSLDYDGDGRDDLLFVTDGALTVYQATGRYELAEIGPLWGAINGDLPLLVGDVDGDGSPDLFGITAGVSGTVAFGSSGRQGRLQTVVDGLGKRDDVSYDGRTKIGDEPGTVATYRPQYCGHLDCPTTIAIGREGPLVSGVIESDVGTGARGKRFVYDYSGARASLNGEGDFGFGARKIYLVDDADHIHSLTSFKFYNEDKVRAGAVAQSTVELVRVAQNTISPTIDYSSSRVVRVDIGFSSRGLPFPEATSGYEYRGGKLPNDTLSDVQFSLRSWTANVNEYGAVDHHSIQDTGPNISILGQTPVVYETTTIDTTYYPADEDAWQIAMPQDVTTQSDAASETAIRTVHYDYYGNGLIQNIIRQKDDPDLYLQVHLARDNSYGNVDGIVTSSSPDSMLGAEERTEAIEFDDRQTFPLTITDAEQHVTEFDFDPETGNDRVIADPNHVFTRFGYDGFGRLKEVATPDGSTHFDYSSTGTFTSPVIGTVPAVLQTTRTPPVGGAEVTAVNAFGQIVSIDAVGFQGTQVQREFAYDWNHRLVQQSLPHEATDSSQGLVSITYDPTDRVSTVTSPDGGITRHFYAPSAWMETGSGFRQWLEDSGNPDALFLHAVVSPRGTVQAEVSDHAGRPVLALEAESMSATDIAAAHTSSIDYGPFSMRRHVRTQNTVTEIRPDFWGRPVDLDDPDTGNTHRVFSAWDEVAQITDAKQEVRIFNRDHLGRLLTIEHPDGELIAKWVYDGSIESNEVGRLRSAYRQSRPGSTTGNTITYHYQSQTNGIHNAGRLDHLDRTLADANGTSHTLTTSFSYDAHGRLDVLGYPDAPGDTASAPREAFQVQQEYDPASGLLADVKDAASGHVYWKVVAADQGFRVSHEHFGNGIDSLRTYYSLNDSSPQCASSGGELGCMPGMLHTIRTGKGSPTSIQDSLYEFDRNGNLRHRTARDGTDEQFTYDGFNQLTSRTRTMGDDIAVTNYHYNELGNIDYRSDVGDYAYEGFGPHAVSSAGTGTEYHYDANGNQDTRTGDLVAGGYQELQYNDFQLPWRITTGQSSPKNTDFEYDAFQQRTAKHAPAEDTLYAGNLYEQVITSGQIEHRYKVFAAGLQIAQVTKVEVAGAVTDSNTEYIHADHLGSATAVTDSSGALQSARTYGPYGDTTANLASSDIRAGFTGHEHDADLGLINMRGRLYDPAIGRFLQADPIVQSRNPRASNRYAYVLNNPLSWTDPSGFNIFGDFMGWLGFGSRDDEDGASEGGGNDYSVMLDAVEWAEEQGGGGGSGAQSSDPPNVDEVKGLPGVEDDRPAPGGGVPDELGCPQCPPPPGPGGPGQAAGAPTGGGVPSPIPTGGGGPSTTPDPGGSTSLGGGLPQAGGGPIPPTPGSAGGHATSPSRGTGGAHLSNVARGIGFAAVGTFAGAVVVGVAEGMAMTMATGGWNLVAGAGIGAFGGIVGALAAGGSLGDVVTAAGIGAVGGLVSAGLGLGAGFVATGTAGVMAGGLAGGVASFVGGATAAAGTAAIAGNGPSLGDVAGNLAGSALGPFLGPLLEPGISSEVGRQAVGDAISNMFGAAVGPAVDGPPPESP